MDIVNCKPHELSDDKLNEYINFCWQSISGGQDYTGTASYLIAEKNSRFSKKSVRLSLKIAFLALFVAGISAVFSFIDWVGDKGWQKDQIQILRDIHKTLSPKSSKGK